MMFDLFSSLDNSSIFGVWFGFVSFLGGFGWLVIFKSKVFSYLSSGELLAFKTQSFFMNSVLKSKTFQYMGVGFFLSNLFLVLFLSKIWGLVPFIFSVTSQFSVTIVISLMCWMSIVASSLGFYPILFFSHLSPLGSPLWLVPLLKVIEAMSNLIRFLTLCLRISINLTTGHMFLCLMGVSINFCFFKNFWGFVLCLFLGGGYVLFEGGISLIQGLVFTLLLNQYLEEHP